MEEKSKAAALAEEIGCIMASPDPFGFEDLAMDAALEDHGARCLWILPIGGEDCAVYLLPDGSLVAEFGRHWRAIS